MSTGRTIARIALGTGLVFAGITHLTVARKDFQAQVPSWVPADPDAVVLASGVAEIGLGTSLLLARKRRRLVGSAAAAFFVAIFPGNISQYRTQTSAFGLDTDRKRFVRLFFQPLLVAMALFGTR
jgi:uncharacterized membrane protein